jgi:aspartate-semialdehyde dehydrogenase
MKLAVIGATGLVGSKMLQVLEERKLPITELIPAASPKSAGKELMFNGKLWKIVTIEEAIAQKPAIAIFSAGSGPSLQYAPEFAAVGTFVIDNSSAWRMNEEIPLVVPEINADVITTNTRIIANPNCSTIQMVMALYPLHQFNPIKRIVVSTYQSVSGTGIKAVAQMEQERQGTADSHKVYPHPIDKNILPHIDSFLESGYTKEEMKMVNETKKIMRAPDIKLTATAVRVPVVGGHSESVNVEFENPYELADIYRILKQTPGVIVTDEPANNLYPMPIHAEGKDEVFVGRIRRDDSIANGLNMWIVADNLRKGAATNAVQIAQYLIKNKLV